LLVFALASFALLAQDLTVEKQQKLGAGIASEIEAKTTPIADGIVQDYLDRLGATGRHCVPHRKNHPRCGTTSSVLEGGIYPRRASALPFGSSSGAQSPARTEVHPPFHELAGDDIRRNRS